MTYRGECIDICICHANKPRPGFTSTASCESKITFIDGEKGILRYRGYDIEELAKKSDFIEVVNLLIYGDLPNKDQLIKYKKLISRHTLLHEQIINFFQGFRRDAHPMAMMVGVIILSQRICIGDASTTRGN